MVIDTTLYDILGVDPSVDERQLKAAYRHKARESHPDKNPDDPEATEKFQKIQDAYEVLKDPDRRKIYDEYGVEGLRENAGDSMSDILSHLFNFDGPSRRRTSNIDYNINATLEQLYNGADLKLDHVRHVPCKKCNARGTKEGVTPKICEACEGQGSVTVIKNLGGLQFYDEIECEECHGFGEIIAEEDKCEECHGEKLIKEESELDVHIERGMEDGDRLYIRGASNEIPNFETGDVCIHIAEIDHPIFMRKHSHLLMEKTLTLTEALFGKKFVVKHLDGRKLVIDTSDLGVISPGDTKVIKREGMPIRGNPIEKGDLYIYFKLELPEKEDLTPELKEILYKVQPPIDEAKGIDLNAEDTYVLQLEEADIAKFHESKRAPRERRNESYEVDGDDDEEDAGDAQCSVI